MFWVEEDASLHCSTSSPFSTRLKRKFGVSNRSVGLFRRKKDRDEGVSRKESKVVVTNYKRTVVNGKAIMVEADVEVGCKSDVRSRLIAPANKDKQPFVSHTKAVKKVKTPKARGEVRQWPDRFRHPEANQLRKAEKFMLWDYLQCEITRWKGQVVIMGDFNEVRVQSDRYGSVFNARGAQRFNSFISDSGLVEINLGGCHYTWCHKSAKKMSKLDRFLVSENLINNSPNITAISLDRYLSDHRPILLRERYVDYGPTPFKFFHYWLDIEGFNKIVEDAWKSYVVKDVNAIRHIMGKFKFVKSKIREWNASFKNGTKKDKDQCIRDLVIIDDIIDSGNGGEEDVLRRAEIVNKMQMIDGLLAKELAQKTKIKWAIEGDENSKFFHGSILVNGCPTEEFQYGKGLKQGDPLSPFLFILIMESLHLSFQRIVDEGMFKGIKLGGDMVNLSHMFYADDAVFVGQWCESNITTLVHVLDCFYKVSGLRINMSKSKIMGVHVDDEKVNRAADKLGCLVFKTPFAYLGSIVGGNMSRKHLWNETVDKVKLWDYLNWKFNTHLYWRVPYLNQIELRYGLEYSSSLHGVDGRIGTSLKGGQRSCWTSIIQEVNNLGQKGIDFMSLISIKLGNGEKTRFWEDKWCADGILKTKYPRLYALESCKLISVGTKLSHPSICSSFRRNPRGGNELDQLVRLEDDLKGVVLSSNDDRWVWELESTGDFSVSSIRNLIDKKFLPNVELKTRWNKFIPIKINIHTWKIMTNSLPTRFNISCRGICIDSILCATCGKGVETTSHLFFSCSVARDVVKLITRWWCIDDVELESFDDWEIWFDNVRLPQNNKKMLEGVFFVTWWYLWLFRNKILFNTKSPVKALLFDEVSSNSFYWCRYRSKYSFGWNDWLKNPHLISL
ncbi:RNA-directed DNA polymerase, eukaryota [Tanacetum coccineum]